MIHHEITDKSLAPPDPAYFDEIGFFKHIEIEINTACDLACFGCDRFSDVTRAPNMTVEQVALFVKESLDLNWEWERIRFLGGEPTLHPKFEEMCLLLVEYRNRFPKVFLQVLTNGVGKSKDFDLKRFCGQHRIYLHAEQKAVGVQPAWFTNTRIVPLDRDPNCGELPPCSIFGIRGCGIGLTRHGFFLDGAGASIARVAGYDIGVMSLKDVTFRRMLEQAKPLCCRCGHWNATDATFENGKIVTKLISETGMITGKFWTETLAAYNKEKPKLKIYGTDK